MPGDSTQQRNWSMSAAPLRFPVLSGPAPVAACVGQPLSFVPARTCEGLSPMEDPLYI